jgi:hypothetical protein
MVQTVISPPLVESWQRVKRAKSCFLEIANGCYRRGACAHIFRNSVRCRAPEDDFHALRPWSGGVTAAGRLRPRFGRMRFVSQKASSNGQPSKHGDLCVRWLYAVRARDRLFRRANLRWSGRDSESAPGETSCERVAQALHFMCAPPDRHRDHVCSPLAAGVDGARLFDAQGIDGLHDRGGDRAGGDRYRALLLFAIPHDRFRIDIGDTLVDCGVDDRVDLAGAVTWFYDWCGVGTGINSGSNFALASLPLAPAFRLTDYVRQLALPLSKRIIPAHSHSPDEAMEWPKIRGMAA